MGEVLDLQRSLVNDKQPDSGAVTAVYSRSGREARLTFSQVVEYAIIMTYVGLAATLFLRPGLGSVCRILSSLVRS